jgi:hypothetical protein
MAAIVQENEIKINVGEQYRKQSYRTRAQILGPHQIEILNINVKKAPNNTPIKEIRLDYHENWQKISWKTLENCYKNSPFFEETEWYFQKLFSKKYDFLIDINLEALEILLKIFKIKKEIQLDSYSFFEYRDEFLSFNPKKPKELPSEFVSQQYPQVFGDIFVPNLSVIDLVFSQGPQSVVLLKKSWQV